MMKFVDRQLDHITMYRLVLYYLVGLLAAAVVLGAVGWWRIGRQRRPA